MGYIWAACQTTKLSYQHASCCCAKRSTLHWDTSTTYQMTENLLVLLLSCSWPYMSPRSDYPKNFNTGTKMTDSVTQPYFTTVISQQCHSLVCSSIQSINITLCFPTSSGDTVFPQCSALTTDHAKPQKCLGYSSSLALATSFLFA